MTFYILQQRKGTDPWKSIYVFDKREDAQRQIEWWNHIQQEHHGDKEWRIVVATARLDL